MSILALGIVFALCGAALLLTGLLDRSIAVIVTLVGVGLICWHVIEANPAGALGI